jgi:putative CocE/NonD family hydrolase
MHIQSPRASLFSTPRIASIKMLLLPLAVTGLLIGCSGSSSSGDDPAANPPVEQITTDDNSPTPDDSVTEEEQEEGSSEEDVSGVVPHSAPNWDSGYYKRDYDYPAMVTLPVQFITTTSGKKLVASVTLPANENGEPIDGKFPVVLIQTGYNLHLLSAAMKSIPGMSILGSPDKLIVRHGYAQVSVDVIGTGASEGGWEMFGEAEQVAYGDTVDWVLEQPWSNGNIGVAGVSYMAISALFTAERRPDAIKTVFAMEPIGDAMRGIVGTGGLINGLFISVWGVFTHQLSLQNQLPAMLYPEYREHFEAVNEEHIGQIDNYLLPLVEDALSGAPYITYDSEFWRTRSTLEHVGDIKAPTFITGTLHDLFQRDEPLLYEQLKKNVDARLVIYDGDHITNFLQAFPGGDEVDPVMSLYLQWFDKYLKDIDSDIESIPAVTQYVKNYGQLKPSKALWRGFATTTDWPHPEVGAERWYLHGDMTLDTIAPNDTESTHSVVTPQAPDLSWGKSADGKYLEAELVLHDGTDCSISYRQWTLGIAGVFNNKPCYHESNDVEEGALNFESAAMEDNYYFNGPVQADIWIDSSATDAVVSVRLDEVSPDGVVKQISNGLLLASNRAVDESRSRFIDGEMVHPVHYLTEDQVMPVVPGEVIKLPVEIFPTSAIILKGHKLRISIAASNQAQGILNWPRQEQMKDAVITVHNSPDYPSSIVLPVVPMSALN